MIPLMKNAFINEYETKQALADFIMKAPRLSMDSACSEFERNFAAYQQRKDAILFNSGGSANLALLHGNGFVAGHGDILGLILDPTAPAGQDQPFIIGVQFNLFEENCLCA